MPQSLQKIITKGFSQKMLHFILFLEARNSNSWLNNFLIPTEKHFPGKNVFCSMNIDKIRRKGIFEIIHGPLELLSN